MRDADLVTKVSLINSYEIRVWSKRSEDMQ